MYELLQEYAINPSDELRNRIVEKNYGLIVVVARNNYHRTDLEYEDFLQEVTIVMMEHTIPKFDLTRGRAFGTKFGLDVKTFIGLQNNRRRRRIDIKFDNGEILDLISNDFDIYSWMESNRNEEYVEELLTHFTERERQVYDLLLVEELSLRETGKQLGISHERVRQIWQEAIKKLKKEIEND